MDMDSADSGGVTLKSLLQNPFLLLPKEKDEQQKPDIINKDGDAEKKSDKQKEKEKEAELNFDPFGNVDPMNAFLGPKLWDDSMLYGDQDLKFEFMDIDEFLVEQGILDPSKGKKTTEQTKDNVDNDSASAEAIDDGDSIGDTASEDVVALPVSPQEVIPMSLMNQTTTESTSVSLAASLSSPPRTPSPVAVDVNFELSHTDVALATIPGEDTYDPRSKVFNEEELKPQPMIKKAKKVFVPEEQKDDKYWARRRKNNVAAKRSREARRIKENQIVLRAAYLEKENGALKQEVVGLKKENMSLKSVVQKLEKELKNAQEQASLLS